MSTWQFQPRDKEQYSVLPKFLSVHFTHAYDLFLARYEEH